MKEAKTILIIDFPNEDDSQSSKSKTCSILLDGKSLADITSGEKKEFAIQTGKHTLFLSRKNYTSSSLDFTAKPYKEVYLEIRFEAVEPYPNQFEVVQSSVVPAVSQKPDMRRS